MFSLVDPALFIPLIVAVGLLPVVAVMVTSYTKIVVVLGLLKNALGLQQVPPASVTNGLALIMTWYVMYPVGLDVWSAIEKLPQGGRNATALQVVAQAKEPLREFLDKHAAPRERAFFMDASRRIMGEKVGNTIGERDFVVLVPAFTVTELTEAFMIGFIIFLPFIVIDLVVANILMALGMQMVSPTTISLPFKLLLFVMLDGWSRLLHALILTYR